MHNVIRFPRRFAVAVAATLPLALLSPALAQAAEAAPIEFSAPPGIKTNAMWRVDTQTGEMGFCFFTKPEGEPIGSLICPKPGENAGPQQERGPYGLQPTNYDTELGMFRVNRRTGSMSMCYNKTDDKNSRIVCTPVAK